MPASGRPPVYMAGTRDRSLRGATSRVFVRTVPAPVGGIRLLYRGSNRSDRSFDTVERDRSKGTFATDSE